MLTRVLGTWVAAALVVGSASAVARAPHEPPRVAVTTDPGADVDLGWAAGEPLGATTTVVAPATTTAGPTSSAPRKPSPTTTAPPKASPLVAQTAQVTQPGVWVVRRDGTGLQRVESQCRSADRREWLSESELVVARDLEQSAPFRMRLDGSTSPFPQPTLTDPRTGQQIQIRGIGTFSPDHRSMAIQYGGPVYGVAVVDLATGTATVVQAGENPLPTWSPNGDVLFVGPNDAVLYGPDGGVVRTTTPSPVGMFFPWLRWSPDGSRIVGAPMADPNKWVVFNPRTGASQAIPHLGPGGRNEVLWGGNGTLVVGEPGIDHGVKPTTRAYDLATGQERVLAEAAAHPQASAASQLVAFEDARTYRTIGLVTVDGSRRADLVTVPSGLWASPASWSPSGNLLMFNVCADTRGTTGGLPTT